MKDIITVIIRSFLLISILEDLDKYDYLIELASKKQFSYEEVKRLQALEESKASTRVEGWQNFNRSLKIVVNSMKEAGLIDEANYLKSNLISQLMINVDNW